MEERLNDLGKYIALQLPGAVKTSAVAFGELNVEIEPGEVVRVMKFLRDDAKCAFTLLIDICGVDWPQRPQRFDVVYHLLSLTNNFRIRIKLVANEDTAVPSVVALYPTANWFEREAFDMYGISFADHPDLRRILSDYGFSGHPLRKDFPLTGYVELRYDDEQKRVVYQPVQLVQEYRDFDFMSPWEGMRTGLPGDEKAAKDKA